jgi:(3R)-3-hydroxyacyl-CoA dehydrogenase / 3a,7a,12a-trihydroxy-5b-cholest-24-enoyl-CoA hydratase / enoyl-CoA hydratase 2
MSDELRFDGRVAVVTGAGGGLGRSHALLLASRGAKVVVNDLGGSHTGEGASQSAADHVVAEIAAAGGEAVANYDSVENGEAIVKTAMDAFGRVDIVINNAGILRDVSFQKMTQEDWDLIYRVHVLGSFRVTHAAWPIMREQEYGRVVMTASAAGIYGNFGQANYSMAKLGVYGLANTLAIEGRRRNILVNTIAPIAGSRMTETVLPKELLDTLKPEYVTPLVARLCHEASEESGGLFEVGGGFYGRLRWERAAGKLFRVGRPISVEDVDAAWGRITGFDEATHPNSVAASMQPIMENVQRGPSKGGNRFIDVDEALGYAFPERRSRYDERDLAIYALGVGAAEDPANDKELQLVYEMHGRGMKALPTYAVVPAVNTVLSLAKEGHQAPGLNYGLDRILHGEQYTELYVPLPTKAELTHRARIKDIFDKGKHALVVTEVVSYDEQGEALMRNEITTLIRGAGGWGGDRGPAADLNEPPARDPDAIVEETIPANQALLYRLSGDWNPLHADPGFAKAFGFERPILHGLCTFGYAGRHVVSTFAPEGDPRYFKSIRTRFSDSVFPGETLVTEMWKEPGGKIVFRCKVRERDSLVISNAAVELYEELPEPKPKPKPRAEPARAASAQPAAEPEPTSWDVFVAIRDHVERHPELVAKVKNVYLFEIKDPDAAWTLDLKTGKGAVVEGKAAEPDCTLEIAEADFIDMTTGKSDPMKLFSTGKLKISGNVMASQKLEFLQKIDPAEAREAVARARAAGEGPGRGAEASPAAGREAAAPAIFEALSERLKDRPELAGELGGVLQFRIEGPDVAYAVVARDGRAAVEAAEVEDPDAVLTLADADLGALVRGETSAKQLFQQGKLRVDGDVSAAHRLGFLKGLID